MGCNESSCYGPRTSVWMADGSKKLMADIRKGDWVLTTKVGVRGLPIPAEVDCVTIDKKGGVIYRIGEGEGVYITAQHPYWSTKTNRYQPGKIGSTKVVERATEVYNLVLSNRGDVKVGTDGIYVVTLGHGLTGDPVVDHAFYGTEAVLHNLRAIDEPGWREGLVDLTHTRQVRDSNGWVCKYIKE